MSPSNLLFSMLLVTALSSGRLAAVEPAASTDAARVAYAAAAALQNREAWDLAVEQWRALLEEHPADPLAIKGRYYLGVCLVKSGREADAEAVFREVLSSRADADTLGMARYELAAGAYRRASAQKDPKAFAAAARSLEAFLEAEPNRPEVADALHLCGEAQWQSGNRDRAFDAWRLFVERHGRSPRLPEVLYALGLGLAESGRHDEAAPVLARFAKEFPGHRLAGDVAIWRADVATARGRFDEAEQSLGPLLVAGSPRRVEALERVADIRWKQADWQGAADAYGRLAAASDPVGGRKAAILAGRALVAARKPDEARRLFEGVLAAEGGDAADAADAAHRLAQLELEAGRPDEALAAAARGLGVADRGTIDPALAAELALDRADALWEMPSRRREAAEAYEQLLERHPASPAALTAATMAAVALLETGDAKTALERTEQALARLPGTLKAGEPQGFAPESGETVPDSAAVTLQAVRAESLIALGRTREAADAYQALAKAHPSAPRRPTWIVRQAVALAADKDWDAVRGCLADRKGLTGSLEAEGLYLDALAAVEQGSPAEARPLLDELLARHRSSPRREEAAQLAIRAAQEAGDAAGALAVAERVAKEAQGDSARGPGAASAWYRLGQLRQQAGRHDDAITAFNRSIEADPGGPRSAWALVAVGWCHEDRGRFSDAIAAWSRLINSQPDSKAALSALLARADVRQRSGDLEGGLTDARGIEARKAEILERLDADALSEARLVEGLCLAGLGRNEEAATTLFRLLKEHPRFRAADRALFELGVVESLAGRAAESRKAFAAIHRHFPESRYAADAWLELGESHWEAREWNEAARCYAAAIEAATAGTPRAGPGLSILEQARHKLGWTHLERGDRAAATAAFSEQVRDFPEGGLAADGRVMLGDALLADGRAQEAVGHLARALADPARLSSPAIVGLAFVRASESEAALGRWKESLAIAERFIRDHPDSPRIDEGRYAAAWARQNLGRLEEAIEGYRGIADASRTPLAARARLMEGEALFEQKRHGDAIRAFFKVAYGFGEAAAPAAYHPWQAQATFEAARCFEVLGKADQAKALYAELIERYPESQPVPAARKRLSAFAGAAASQESR